MLGFAFVLFVVCNGNCIMEVWTDGWVGDCAWAHSLTLPEGFGTSFIAALTCCMVVEITTYQSPI